MERACFTFEIRAGTEAEYQRRHDKIWPAMVRALRASGFANYTLFRRGTTVIGYAECHPGRNAAFTAMAGTEVDQRWQAWFKDLIEDMPDVQDAPRWFDEVWHLD